MNSGQRMFVIGVAVGVIATHLYMQSKGTPTA